MMADNKMFESLLSFILAAKERSQAACWLLQGRDMHPVVVVVGPTQQHRTILLPKRPPSDPMRARARYVVCGEGRFNDGSDGGGCGHHCKANVDDIGGAQSRIAGKYCIILSKHACSQTTQTTRSF